MTKLKTALENGAPWIKVAANYGVGAALALMLTGFLMTVVREGQTAILSEQTDQRKALAAVMPAIQETMIAIRRHEQRVEAPIAELKRIVYLLQVMCLQDAKTAQERRSCLVEAP